VWASSPAGAHPWPTDARVQGSAITSIVSTLLDAYRPVPLAIARHQGTITDAGRLCSVTRNVSEGAATSAQKFARAVAFLCIRREREPAGDGAPRYARIIRASRGDQVHEGTVRRTREAVATLTDNGHPYRGVAVAVRRYGHGHGHVWSVSVAVAVVM
jgi:hypothetical protein